MIPSHDKGICGEIRSASPLVYLTAYGASVE